MNPAQLKDVAPHTRELLREFVESGGCLDARRARSVESLDLHGIAEALAETPAWGSEEILWTRFVFEVCAAIGETGPLMSWCDERGAEVLQLLEQYQPGPDPARLGQTILLSWHRKLDWTEADDGTPEAPFRSAFANFGWQQGDLYKGFCFHQPKLLKAIATRRPEVIEAVLRDPAKAVEFFSVKAIRGIMQVTDRFDPLIAERIEGMLSSPVTPSALHLAWGSTRVDLFTDYLALLDRHSGHWNARVLEMARSWEFAGTEEAVQLLLENYPSEALVLVAAANFGFRPNRAGPGYQRIFQEASADFSGTGGKFLAAMLDYCQFEYGLAKEIFAVILSDPAHPSAEEIRELFLRKAATLKGAKLAEFWKRIALSDAGLFEPEWRRFSTAKGQQLREAAADWLQKHGLGQPPGTLSPTASVDERIGAATLLAKANREDTIGKLKAIHATDPSKQVREAVARLLEQTGHHVAPEPTKTAASFANLAGFEASLAAKAKTIRLPTAPWLNVALLPPLFARDGTPVGELARTFLFQVQAREGSGEVSIEALPLLEHLDRERNAPFAHALLDQWLASDMKASTRWAVDVAGLTGNDSLIPRLVQPIPEWCRQNAGKRAEWTTRAIGLIATPGALRELDALTHRYRIQRRYVAEAAAGAIRTLAALQGISEDEIAERIVPDFGFDDAGENTFTSPAGDKIIALLRPDLKVAWQTPDGRESAKPPTNLPAAEVKDWLKLFKQAVTSQTLRLERAMVDGRRWETAAWQERFDKHPLFRCFAGSQVWATYDTNGARLRTFRRYSNGIFADAQGEPEEFEDAASIGLPHPIDLDPGELAAWAAHLKRMKVVPAFPQIARAIGHPDPLHGSRREVRIAEGKTLDAAVLRTRMLGRGWSPAPTGSGGSVSRCVRKFGSAGIEAHLALEDFYAASGKGDEVELGVAFFARAPTAASKIRPGTTPFPDDARVLRFEEVPTLVWSETITDLNAILGA